MHILILGAGGFIGSNLITYILNHRDWHIHALDLHATKLTPYLSNPRLHFKQGDMRDHQAWIEQQVQACDVVIPLAAIASPATYVQNPLSVFELDFEYNLAIVRLCVKHNTRLIFPSTSEVYGMQNGIPCSEETSNFITGPVHKERWIYASSKQLLDRVIYAYGAHHHLPYTLFRPFNWYGPGLDNVWENASSNRVIATFLHSLLHKRNITLIDGGAQKRCFLYIDDAIDALMRIIENKNGHATNTIFNIGHPGAEASIADLAETMLTLIAEHPAYTDIRNEIHITATPGGDFYGAGYQDIDIRIPDIAIIEQQLGWTPTTSLYEGLRRTIAHYIHEQS